MHYIEHYFQFQDRTKFTQFIIISLRSNMFELADSLLGVYKVDNMSYSIRIGVNKVVNKLKGVHQMDNRPYQMGFDDHNSLSARKNQTSSVPLSQATTVTVPTLSQPGNGVTIAGSSDRRPSLDISAIQDPNTTAETDRISQQSSRPASVATNHEENKTDENEDEPMDVTSELLFENSFEEVGAGAPLASSTPCATAPPKRMSLRKNQNSNELSEVREEASASSDDSSALSEALSSLNSSANNSQT